MMDNGRFLWTIIGAMSSIVLTWFNVIQLRSRENGVKFSPFAAHWQNNI